MADYVYNTEGEFGKYVVQENKFVSKSKEFTEFYKTYANRLLWMDSNVVPGAFQMNMSWYHSASPVRPLLRHDEHVHEFDELIGFLGTDPENPYDLGAEIEVGVGGELHRLTKSSMIFLPAGLKHLPLSIISLDKPVLHFSISMNPFYGNTKTANATKPTDSAVKVGDVDMTKFVYNTEGEFGKQIVQTLQAPKFSPGFAEFYKTYANRLLWMDGKVVPGAFQMNTSWYHHASDCRPLRGHDEHVHEFDELIGFIGSNPDDPYDLGAEIEVGIGGELHRLTKSSMIFMPAGMKHLPLSIISLDRPVLHFSISMASYYGGTSTKTGEKHSCEEH